MVQKAIFIGIDGVQLEQALLLGLQGKAQALNALDIVESYVGGEEGTGSQQATSSGPGWSTLLTGVWVDQHGIPSNNSQPIVSEVDSIFEYVDAAIPDAKIASVVNWSPINTGHFAREMGLLEDEAVVDEVVSGLSDENVTDTAVDLIANEAPDFMFVHLDDVDGAGHSSGFGDAYEESIDTASQQLGEILAAVEQRMADYPDEDWLVIVSTDHGRDPLTGSGHGGQTDSERRSFIASNKELASFDDPVPATSVVTTILDHLDIPYELSADGLVSGSLLEGAPDPIPPQIEALLSPEDDAGSVSRGADLTIRFSEDIQPGSGKVVVKLVADDSVVATVDVTSDQVSIAGDTVTIDLPADLAYDTDYYVQIDEGAFTDGVNGFAGIDDSVTWNFTTEADLVAPEALSFGPADDAVDVPLGSDLTIQLDEPVIAGSGNITILRSGDDSVVEVIDVTSDQVTIDGSSVTIDPAADLEPGTEYYVLVDQGALRDTATRTTLYSEDFEGLALDPFVSPTEGGGDGTDFTADAPDGWVQDNTTPEGGPAEFFGWTFLDKNSWTVTAGDQGRAGFTKGSGTVMVADPDEYDDGDTDVDPNQFNAYIKTPAIDLSGVAAGSATVTFDSSWRPEDSQKAVLTVSYDGGAPVELLRFTSDPTDPDFKDDAVNETLSIDLDNPEGASSAVISFGVIEAGNDWWWAIDNVVVQGDASGAGVSGNAYAGISDKTAWSFTTEGDTVGGGDDPVNEIGTNGDDILMGGSGDDTLLGGRGDDSLEGGDGDDQLDGGRHDDTVDGGGGDDSILGGRGDDAIDGGDGDDKIFGDRGDDSLTGGEGDDVIDAGRDDDLAAGGQGDDTLLGDRGDDTLDGGEDDDVLDGGRGDDLLSGGEGDDVLTGDRGDDTLDGGEGDDILEGGRGDDLFVFEAGTGFDVVTDFESGDDLIQLNGFAITDFDDLLDVSLQDGGDVVIALDEVAGDELRLVGIDKDDLSSDDFMFSAA